MQKQVEPKLTESNNYTAVSSGDITQVQERRPCAPSNDNNFNTNA